MSPHNEITRVLEELRQGDPDAFPRLIPLVYAELRALAQREMRGERGDHTLQPTALVNEAYLRLLERSPECYRDRKHFLSAAAQAMRRVLVDHARKRRTRKRGGGWQKLPVDDVEFFGEDSSVDLLDFSDALEKLERRYPKKARVVELRIFVGLTVKEAAELLRITTKTVERHWTFAKAWLSRELQREIRPGKG